MRAITLRGLLILGFAAVIIVPAVTSGQYQPGGGGFKKGQKGGMDANSVFDWYAKGQPFVLISNIRRNQDLAAQFAKEKGITNGQLNRAQFLAFQEQLKAKLFATPGGGKKFSPDAGAQPGVVMAPSLAPNPDFVNSLADSDFRRLDANSDGKLNQDEIPDRMKANLAKWDKNRDGLIDLLEYREYYREAFAARLGGTGGGAGNSGDPSARSIASIIIDIDELDRKTIVYRAGGKMPAGLPAWFKELDTDGDGQVALYEWRKAGKALDEFKDWDLNDDGFITPEEAVRVQTALGTPGTPGRPLSSGPDGGGFKGKGKKKGNGNGN